MNDLVRLNVVRDILLEIKNGNTTVNLMLYLLDEVEERMTKDNIEFFEEFSVDGDGGYEALLLNLDDGRIEDEECVYVNKNDDVYSRLINVIGDELIRVEGCSNIIINHNSSKLIREVVSDVISWKYDIETGDLIFYDKTNAAILNICVEAHEDENKKVIMLYITNCD